MDSSRSSGSSGPRPMISSVICSSMRTRSARVRARPSSSMTLPKISSIWRRTSTWLDRVELGVEVLDDPVLDPELDVPERLAHGRLAGQPALGRHVRRPAARRRRQVGAGRPRRGARGSGGSRPSTLDPLQQRHRLHPFSPRGANCDCVHRHANSDFFCVDFRSGVAAVVDRSPTTDRAKRRMSWETWASRLERKKGTPRLSA